MSSHRQTAPARRRAFRPRLDLTRLEAREVPAVFTLGVDPAVDMKGAVAELRAAVAAASGDDAADIINLFPGGVYEFVDTVGGGDALPNLLPAAGTKSATTTLITVNGNGATLRRASDFLDANGKTVTIPAFRLFTVRGDTNGFAVADIRDLTIENGNVTGSGGAVQVVNSPVLFQRVRFRDNTASAYGGAVVFSNNPASFWTSRFDQCFFEDNSGKLGGGGVSLSDGSAGSFDVENTVNYVFTQSQFTNNTTTGNGGGLLARDDDFFLSGVTLAYNTAGVDGGGLYVTSDRWRVNSTIGTFGNTLGFLENSTVFGNTAGNKGGGLFVDGGWTDMRLYNATVNFNSAAAGGGGIHWANTIASPPGRVNSTFVRVELSYSVIAENTSGTPEFQDLRGWFFDATVRTDDVIALPSNVFLGYGNNYVGVVDPGTIFNTDSSQQAGITQQGTSAAPLTFGLAVDAKGGPLLQDNGGGLLTRLPAPGSPLIDAGRAAVYPELESLPGQRATSDQRGTNSTRIAVGERGLRMDIGAVEVQAVGSVALIKVAGDNQAVSIRAAFGTPLQVRTLDRYGQPLAGQTVGAAVIPAGPGATFPLGSTATTDAAGYASLYPVANKTGGTYDQIVAIGQNIATFTLTNRTRLNFIDVASGDGQSAQVNTTYGAPLRVQVTRDDGTGNFVGIAGVTVSFLVASANGDTVSNPAVLFTSGATAAGGNYATVTTDADGFAQVDLKANTKAGPVTVLASATGKAPNGNPLASGAISFFVTNTAGPTTKLSFLTNDPLGTSFSGNNQSALVPNLFDKQLAVLAGDDFGNPAPGQTVTFATDPANPAQAVFPNGATVTTDAQGIGRVTVGAGDKAGTYTVTATAAGLSPQTFTLTNLPGLPVGLTVISGTNQSAVVTDPAVGSGTVGAFTQPLVVEARDAGGNVVPNANITFQGPGIGAGARFEPTAANTGTDGRAAVFAVPNSISGTYTVTAQVQTGNGAFATTPFTLTNLAAAPAAVDIVSGGGQTAQAGNAFGQPVVVRVLDRFQNPVAGVTPVVTSPGATFIVAPTGADGLSTVQATAGGTAGPTAGTVRVGSLPPVTFPLTVTGLPPGKPVPPVGLPTLTAVGLDGGIASRVTVYNADGSVRTQFAPFDPGFLGGSRAAIARVPAPAAPTVVVVPGPGRFPDAQVFNADTGDVLATYQPFEQTFTGGVFVAAADVDRDGWEDYVFSPDQGGGPRVQIRSGRNGAVLQDFFAIEDAAFRGGVRTALGDLNGDGVPDLIVAAGFGGGPRIAVYDGKSLTGFRATPVKLIGDFFAFESTLRNGAYVAAGDVTGDGLADVVLGGGPGGGPRVRVLNGPELLAGRQTVVSDFFAGPSTDRGGVKVTVRELDENPATPGSKGDIVTASGAGDGSRVSVYLGKDLRVGQPIASRGFDDLAGFRGGVFVG